MCGRGRGGCMERVAGRKKLDKAEVILSPPCPHHCPLNPHHMACSFLCSSLCIIGQSQKGGCHGQVVCKRGREWS